MSCLTRKAAAYTRQPDYDKLSQLPGTLSQPTRYVGARPAGKSRRHPGHACSFGQCGSFLPHPLAAAPLGPPQPRQQAHGAALGAWRWPCAWRRAWRQAWRGALVAVLLQPLGTLTPNAGGRRRSKEPPSVLLLAVREGIEEARTVWGLGHESTAPNDSLHVWGEVAPWALQLRVRMLPARLREVWAVYGPMTFAAPVAAGHEARLSSTLALARELDF